MKKNLAIVFVLLFACVSVLFADEPAPKPLYSDPIYDGAADPVVIWNKSEKKWFMFYTNRRANVEGLRGVSWVHGTPIGIAESSDNGVNWKYRCDAKIDYGEGEFSYWAPEVIEYEGTYHMYLTFVPGIPEQWTGVRHILHLSSKDLIEWKHESTLKLASDYVIDACVIRLEDGTWRMWYNNEPDGKSIYFADSPDLYNWTDKGKVIGDRAGEGPKVVRWKGKYLMFVDNWRGLGVYHSDDANKWTKQDGFLLAESGSGKDDQGNGLHADVLVNNDRAYVFYFTHPGRHLPGKEKDHYPTRRSVIQVAELHYENGKITCDREKPCMIDLETP